MLPRWGEEGLWHWELVIYQIVLGGDCGSAVLLGTCHVFCSNALETCSSQDERDIQGVSCTVNKSVDIAHT